MIDREDARWPETVLLALALVAAPFPWLSIFEIGGLSVKPALLTIALLVIVTLVRSGWRVRRPSQLQALVIGAFAFRLVVYVCSLSWARDPFVGAFDLFREVVNFGLFCALLVSIRQMPLTALCRAAFLGIMLQMVATTGVFLGAHFLAGGNPIGEIVKALASWDLRAIRSAFYWGALKILGFAGATFNDRQVSENTTNALGSGLLLGVLFAWHLLPYRSTRRPRGAGRKRPPVLLLIVVGLATLHAMFYILWGMSDRVYAFLAFILFVYVIHAMVMGLRPSPVPRRAERSFVLSIGGMLGLVAGTVALRAQVLEVIARLARNPRFTELDILFKHINEVGLLGTGFGMPVGGAEGATDFTNRFPHNLFLSDLTSFGVLGIVTSVVWFAVLIIGAGVAFQKSTGGGRDGPRSLAAACAIGYAAMTTQIASMGQLYLMGWLALAFGLALVEPRDREDGRYGGR
jgi:hypothetical protein